MPHRFTVRTEATVMAALLHHGLEARSRDTAEACVAALHELELDGAAAVLARAMDADAETTALAPAILTGMDADETRQLCELLS